MRVGNVFVCLAIGFAVIRVDALEVTDLLQTGAAKSLRCTQALAAGGEENSLSPSPQEVLKALHWMAAQNQQSMDYKTARQLVLGRLYLEQVEGQYTIRDIYCLKWWNAKDFGGRDVIGPDLVPDNHILNVEHAWPQSRFSRSYSYDMQKADLHHLFPADATMNSVRGSFKFGEIRRGTLQRVKCSHSKMAQTSSGYRFEPPPEYRGRIARAMFYFSVRYQTKIDADEERVLRKWHHEHPVDEQERILHDEIAHLQGNRNPFVDHPELIGVVRRFQ